jgi:hypothetical protein
MNGAGYIYFWRMDGKRGSIRICKGQFSGLNVSFLIDDCDKPLQKKLGGINISNKRECPPPADVLLVTFDLTIVEGEMQATNVSEA